MPRPKSEKETNAQYARRVSHQERMAHRRRMQKARKPTHTTIRPSAKAWDNPHLIAVQTILRERVLVGN